MTACTYVGFEVAHWPSQVNCPVCPSTGYPSWCTTQQLA
eukprot:CAMPEP_0202919494 /NCGR_PEP_ID=MMETSP1392-20130828/76001_1 /ASSEMBLY_ACC=CAM_ASM_000868 /TAXON_ID=225041 /ORGANISM="Chlamydomonas chlamydogama, Strain SAG 11-48b" /LENGTH=38 /DNA_ID= /DNA_START= /DNA_END= /DNA_ORIENTATION=